MNPYETPIEVPKKVSSPTARPANVFSVKRFSIVAFIVALGATGTWFGVVWLIDLAIDNGQIESRDYWTAHNRNTLALPVYTFLFSWLSFWGFSLKHRFLQSVATTAISVAFFVAVMFVLLANSDI